MGALSGKRPVTVRQAILVVVLLVVFVLAWSSVGIQRNRNERSRAKALVECNQKRLDAVTHGGLIPSCS